MKTIHYALLVQLPILFALGCDKYTAATVEIESTLTGKWQLTEAYISAGGPQYWVDVDEGEEIEFLVDGSFVSDRFSDCSTGDYFMEAEELHLDYDCDGFEVQSQNEDGFITYALELNSTYFVVTPTSGPICIEGCSYKYSRK